MLGMGPARWTCRSIVPIINGGLTKSGLGTMLLAAANTFSRPMTVGTVVCFAPATVKDFRICRLLPVQQRRDARYERDRRHVRRALASTAGNTTGAVTQGAAALTLSRPAEATRFCGDDHGDGHVHEDRHID